VVGFGVVCGLWFVGWFCCIGCFLLGG
jgi:hypothetical protein